MLSKTFRYRNGVLPNLAALSFVLLGYPAGVVLLTQPVWLMQLAGFLLVTQTLVWSGYFVHEFAHQAIFTCIASAASWRPIVARCCRMAHPGVPTVFWAQPACPF